MGLGKKLLGYDIDKRTDKNIYKKKQLQIFKLYLW